MTARDDGPDQRAEHIEQGLPRELRPSWSQYGGWFKKVNPIFAGAIVVLLLGRIVLDGPGGLVIALLIVVVVLGIVAVSMRTSRVELTEEKISYHRWGRATELRLRDGVRGLLAPWIPAGGSFRPPEPFLILQRADGTGPRIRLNGAYWEAPDLVDVGAHAEVRGTAEPLTTAEFEAVEPGIMLWRDRHPWVFGSLVFVLILFLVVVGVTGWFVLTDAPMGSSGG